MNLSSRLSDSFCALHALIGKREREGKLRDDDKPDGLSYNLTYKSQRVVKFVYIRVVFVKQSECRYTLSGPTWIGPGGNVTCTLLKGSVAG